MVSANRKDDRRKRIGIRERAGMLGSLGVMAATLLWGSAAEATNFQVPAGVSGTLVFANSRFSDGGTTLAPAEFGLITRNGSGEATYTKLTLNYADDSSQPFYRTHVNGGEVFEMYVRRNVAGTDPNIPVETFSSDATKNTTLDPSHAEHTGIFTTSLPNYWEILIDQRNYTNDQSAWWEPYDVPESFYFAWVEPACNGTTIPCPDPNVIQSNHAVGIAAGGRDLFTSVIDTAAKVGSLFGPSIGAAKKVEAKSEHICVNARIHNPTWGFVQESIDLSMVQHARANGCEATDGEDFSGPHGLKPLEIKRYHRPKYEYMPVSSFGPGVFSEFDINLTIYPAVTGQESNVVLFDPRSDAPPVNFYEKSTADGDSTVDGVYRDRATRSYRSATFYNTSGNPEPNPRLANTVRVVKHNGESMLFEIINPQGGSNSSASYLAGRLREFKDRSGNVFQVTYWYAANATDDDLGFVRWRLWWKQQAVDMYGVSATFLHTESAVRSMVANIQWQDTGSGGFPELDYVYTSDDRLSEVLYPGGDSSIFGRSFDSTTQTWVMTYDDVAQAGNGLNYLSVYVTGLFYVTPDGLTHSQTPGLIRSVSNGEGERVYQNWEDPNNGNTTYFAQGDGGSGTRMTRMKTNTTGAVLEVARAQTIGPDPLTLTYTVDESYVPTSSGLIGSITNALNQVTAVARNVLGVMTGMTTPDGKTTTTTVNTNGRVTRQVDQLGIITDMTYDTADRLLTTTTAVGTGRAATWKYTYNSKGLMTSMTNPLNVVTDYAYNTAGQLTSVTEPADLSGGTRPVRSFEYDVLGRRTAEVDQAGRRTTFTYDPRGRLVTTTYPDATTEVTTFGGGFLGGEVTLQRDRGGLETSYFYDSTRRLTMQNKGQNQSTGQQISQFEYFRGRYILSAEVQDGTRLEYSYDVRDRQTQKAIFPTDAISLLYKKSYDGADRIVTETDPYNRLTYYVYDANGRLTRKATELIPSAIAAGTNIGTLARITTANPKYVIEDNAYDAVGRMTSHTNERGHLTTFTYDELGRQTKMVEASGTTVARTTTYAYDAANNKTSEVGPRATTAFTYTRRNFMASKTEASGKTEAATIRRTYTLTGALATATDGRAGVTTFTYATTADVALQTKDAANFTTSYTYDAIGNVLTTTDPNSLTTTYTYDGRYRRATEKDALNLTTTSIYDDSLTGGTGFETMPKYSAAIGAIGYGPRARGHAVEVTNPAGEARLMAVDGIGRKVLDMDALGNVTKTGYDSIVNSLVETKTTNPLSKVTIVRQDAKGRARESVDADGKVTKNSYDANGNMVSVRDPNNIGMDCVYNELNQRTSCTNTISEKTSWAYDLDGNITSTTDPIGNVTTCQYDGRNRKTSCTDRLGGVRTFTYDANSNLLTIKDAQNGTTTYTYDARNKQITATYPDSTGSTDKVTVAYDAGGRIQSTKDQSGNTITTTYDASNRLTKTTYPDALNDTYAYDSASRITSAVSGRYSVTTTPSYDAAGRITAENTNVGGRDYRVAYSYDAASRLTTLTYPDGSHADSTYGLNRDLVTQIKLGTFSLAQYAYDNGSRLTSTTFGNTLVETPTYRTNDDRLSQLSTTTVGTLTFTYDKNGNRLTEAGTAAEGNQTFTYDKENRVTNWVGPSLTQSWVLSAEADWTSTTRNSAAAEARTHNAAHELTAVAGTALTYDTRGNMTRDNRNNNMVWDLANRLKQYQKSGGPTVDYLYDAFGRRIGRKVGTSTVIYVFDKNRNVVAEYKDGTLTSNYVFGPGGVDDALAYVNAGRIFWYHKDYLKSVKAVTNEAHVVVERYRYTPYGERTIMNASGTVISATTVVNFIGFTGRPHDVDSGLVDFRSRQYDPRLGRFISRDVAGYKEGASLYRGYFVPNRTDPTGMGSLLGSIYHATVGRVVDPVVSGVTAVYDYGKDALNTAYDFAKDAGNGIVGLAGDVGSAIWDGAKYLGTELWSGTAYLGTEIWRGAEYLGREAWRGIDYVSDLAWRGIEQVGQWIKEGSIIVWNGIKWGANAAWNYVTSRAGIAAIAGFVVEIGVTAVLSFFGVPTPIAGFIGGVLGNLTQDIINGNVSWNRFWTRDVVWGGITGSISAQISPFAPGVNITNWPAWVGAKALIFGWKLMLDHYIGPHL